MAKDVLKTFDSTQEVVVLMREAGIPKIMVLGNGQVKYYRLKEMTMKDHVEMLQAEVQQHE